MTSTTYANADIEYPDTDGQPMAESDYQRPYIAYGTEILNIFLLSNRKFTSPATC